MEAILPFKIKNEQKYFQSALKLGFDEMEIYKFIYVMQQSDLDVFPKMHDERINVLIYCWELCEDYKHKLSPDEWELPEELETILKLLVPWSLDIWFSKEWDKCKSYLKLGLVHCLNRARDLMMRMPDMMQINWDFLLLYNLTPWNVAYLRNLNVTKEKTLETGAQSIETQEQPANSDDLAYVKLEQLPLIVLRLIKLFDQCSIDMVKTLCMRVIAAWNKIYQIELQTTRRPPYIPPEDKRCLLLTCHIYLMAVYESDDVKGYVIDNLINNIRFYFQGFQTSTALYAMDNLEYTPARFIALTTIHLRLKKSEFFDFFIWNSYDTSLVNLFGVVSQAYKSYLLGNLLMELNNMNEDDFALNVPLYKRLMNSYVNEREKSELFLLNELDKLEIQRFAHNVPVVKSMTDFKSKICKGNRMSNIGNYENSDDIIAPAVDDAVKEVEMKETRRPSIKEEEDDGDSEIGESLKDKESDLRLDPIFQNIPNNENILYYVYEVLAKKDYKGWHFAKIVLLVKIIGHELNMIETWRYHPGLTTDFMLNLETKLSNHYADLAKIFKDHAFIEQEFWLTAFYLNPMPDTYETIKRLGMRNNRKRTDEHTKLVMSIDNIDAKYGLLSSTIDVKEIANLANTEEPDGDYDPLFSALKSLHLPDSLIKDMLTAIFLPRNRSFAWIIDWTELRTRCKVLLNNSKEKKRFVELNMAEANERLKFLNIDYEKYKNRPQLDYGTIEAGYENLMNREDYDHSEEEDDEEEEDFEDDEDVYESQRGSRGGRGAAVTKKEEKNEDDNSQEEDPYLTGKRRTRARAAAAVASYLFQSIPRATRRKRNKDNVLVSKDEYDDEKKKDENDEDNSDDNEKDADDKSNNSKSPITTSESKPTSPINEDTKDSDDPDIIKKNIKECLNERPSILNTTPYFQPLIDIWNVEKSDLQSIDNNCVSLLESSMVLKRMAKLKLLNKQTNPLGCNEHEAIDETEMLIINTDFPMAKITNMQKDIKPIVVDSTSETIVKSENRKAVEPVVSNKSSGERDIEIISDESNDRKESKDLKGIKETGEDSDVEMVTEIISDDSNDEKELQELIKNRRRSIRNKHIDLVTEIISDESSEVKESKDPEGDKKPDKDEDIEMVTEIISDESNEEKECKDPIANEETSRDEDIEMVTEIISDESNEEKESKDFKEDEYTEVMDVEEIIDASITKKLNEDEVPVKLSDDKNENKERPSIDDNESFKSDMSTAALKDSEDVSAEVSESNFEINSKQNSEHTDFNEIEYNVDDIIEEITEEEKIKETEQENNKEEEGNKVKNKYDKIMESEATKEDLEKETNEKSSPPDTELSKETKDEIEKDLNEQSNKTDTVLSKESEEDVGKDLTELSNQTDVELLKEAQEDLEKNLTKNSNKNDTKILPETNEKDSELTETSEELNTDKTKESEANESELTQVSTEKDSELPAVIDKTVSTTSSKESENVESEIGKTSEDKESDLIKKDSEIDDTDKTNKSEGLETVMLKDSNVNETKITQKSEATESELTTKDINIVDSEMTSETTAKDLKSSDAEIIKESEKTETELKTKDSNKDGTEISKDSKDAESELTTKSFKNSDKEISKEIQDKESELKAKDPENASTEFTKESKDSESKDSESKSPSDDSKSIVTETAKDSENVKSDLETKDSNSVGKEKIKESKDTGSEIKVHDSKNDDAEIDNESTETKSDLKTQDSKNIDSEISEEKIKESKDSKCESITQDSKNIDSKTPFKSKNIETDLKIKDSEITNEPKDTKSEPLTKDSKNLDDEDKNESKDNTTEEALADKAEHDKDPSTTTSKEESLNADENKADLDLVPKELNSPLLEDISMDSLRFDSDDEQQKSMKQICLTKRVRILMRRLRPEDVANLRQPKIKLKRINIEKAMEEFKATRKKRLLVKKAYLSIDDSSNNSTAGTTDSSDAAYRPPKTKAKLAPRRHSLRQPRTSESEIDSNNSDDVKLLNISSARFIRERRLSSTQHTSSSSNSSTIRSKRHHHTSSSGTTAAASSSAAASHLMVTPRSASGLKLRISNADQSDLVIPRKRRKTVIEVDDVIQLSSSSEDGGRGGSNNLTPIAEVIEIDDHPLFEEEILI